MFNNQGTQLSSKAREEQVKFQNKKEESESIEKLISYLHQRGGNVCFLRYGYSTKFRPISVA